MLNFRTRSDYSLLYSNIDLDFIITESKKDDNKAAILVEKEGMSSAIEFYKEAKKNDLKPVICLEVLLHQADFINERNITSYPIVLLANNAMGYEELMEISSISYLDGLYKKPRINLSFLNKFKNISVIDPSEDGFFWINRKEKEGIEYLTNMKKYFGERFYLGFSISEGFEEISLIAQEYSINLLPTVEAVYKNAFDIEDNLIYRLIDLGHTYSEQTFEKHAKRNAFFRNSETIEKELKDFPEVIKNAKTLIASIDYNLNIGNPTPPKFKFVEDYCKIENLGALTEEEYFALKCREGLNYRLQIVPEELHSEYKARLEYEITVISNMKFPGYMLIVWDFIREAKKLGVPVGPGRGSAAGSLVAFSLEITDIDPIKYGLLFERFLNPERVSMPDIDIDFCTEKRDQVIGYVVNKYGFKSVAQISTFSTLLPKGVIKDVAKVLGISYSESDFVTKKIPDTLESLTEVTDDSELSIFFNSSDLHKKWLQESIKLEGLKRNAGMHAAGVVISDDEIWKKAPIRRDKESKTPITQYSLDYMEDVDLIKFDFLGLKTLTIIEYAKKMVKENHNFLIDFSKMEMNDPNVFELISSGNTIGLFQIESGGMQSLCKAIAPDTFEEVIAILALYRPGPMNSGMVDDFIERKHGRQTIEFDFPALEEVLGPTFGVPVYQEQIMSIVQKIGNFSLGNADVVRRAMGKKKPEIMQQYKQEFIDGGKTLGYDELKTGALFDKIAGFAEYGFNKSHSAAYAMISYQTAWLKCYYPVEFMAALMTFNNEDSDKLSILINEAKRLKINILPPCVNESDKIFSTTKNGSIRFGLSMIKGFGDIAAEEITSKRRRYGKFKKLDDFLSKVNIQTVKKDGLEALIKAGAMDVFGYARARMFQEVQYLTEWSAAQKSRETAFARSIFYENSERDEHILNIPFHKEWDITKRYEYEVAANSVSIATENPIADFIEANNVDVNPIDYDEGGVFQTFIIINSTKQKVSKKGNKFYIAQCINADRSFEALMFDNDYDVYSKLEDKNSVLQVILKITINDAGFKNISIGKIQPLVSSKNKNNINKTGEMSVLVVDENLASTISETAKKVKSGYKKIYLVIVNSSGKAEILDIEDLVDDAFIEKYKKYINMSLKWRVLQAVSGVNK